MSDSFMVRVTDLGDNPAVITASGEVDLATAAQFSAAIQLAAQRSECVEVDLDDVTFLDSAGIRVLVDQARSCPSFRIVNARPHVERVIRLVGVQDIVGLVPKEPVLQ